MASKKNLLSISDPSINRTKFGDFTRNYRQSSNVIDRRAKQFRPTETPKDGLTQARDFFDPGSVGATPVVRGSDRTNDRENFGAADGEDWMVGSSGVSSQTTPTSTRKVTAEEAVRKTHFERN